MRDVTNEERFKERGSTVFFSLQFRSSRGVAIFVPFVRSMSGGIPTPLKNDGVRQLG